MSTATQSRKKITAPVPTVQGKPVEPMTPAHANRTPEDAADRARMKLIDLEQDILKATAEIGGVLKLALRTPVLQGNC